jgi:hypothetical protein
MDVEQYRRSVASQLQSAEALVAPASPPSADELLKISGDANASAAQRRNALHGLKTLAFLPQDFAPYRAQYLSTLREVAADDSADKALRAEALETLAIEKDPVAAQILRQGIANQASAVVSLAKAIQLLAYDDHGAVAAVAREALEKSRDPDVMEEALRALAGDPSAKPIFQRILEDRTIPAEVRAASANGLHILDPGEFESAAQRIVGDASEDVNLRATFMGALASLDAYAQTRVNPTLVQNARSMLNSGSAALRSAASRFLAQTER